MFFSHLEHNVEYDDLVGEVPRPARKARISVLSDLSLENSSTAFDTGKNCVVNWVKKPLTFPHQPSFLLALT